MKLKKLSAFALASVMSFGILGATAASASSSSKPLNDPSYVNAMPVYNRDKSGFTVLDVSHKGECCDAPSRVQIVLFGGYVPGSENYPESESGEPEFDILFELPEGVEFSDIGAARAAVEADWDNWPEDQHRDLQLVTQSSISSWKTEATFKIEDLMAEPVQDTLIENTVKGDKKADYLKIITTTYSCTDELPRPPMIVTITLYDNNGQQIKLLCPVCHKSVCECVVSDPSNPFVPAPPQVPNNPNPGDPGDPNNPNPGDPGDPNNPNLGDPNGNGAADPNNQGNNAQQTATAAAAGGAAKGGTPKGGVPLVVIPVAVAAGAAIVSSKKRKS